MAKKKPNTSFDVAYALNDLNTDVILTVRYKNVQLAQSSIRLDGQINENKPNDFTLNLGKANTLLNKRLKLDSTVTGKDNIDASEATFTFEGGLSTKELRGKGDPKSVIFYYVRVDFI